MNLHGKRELSTLHITEVTTLVDELAYLPIDKNGADLLFQIISQRYERGSTVITTNRVYKKWPEIFSNDNTLAEPGASREKGATS